MIATFLLPATVLRSAGEWPCTSALGLRTRRYSAESSYDSPLSNAMVRVLPSSRSRSSVGQGLEVLSVMRTLALLFVTRMERHKRVHARLQRAVATSGTGVSRVSP